MWGFVDVRMCGCADFLICGYADNLPIQRLLEMRRTTAISKEGTNQRVEGVLTDERSIDYSTKERNFPVLKICY